MYIYDIHVHVNKIIRYHEAVRFDYSLNLILDIHAQIMFSSFERVYENIIVNVKVVHCVTY